MRSPDINRSTLVFALCCAAWMPDASANILDLELGEVTLPYGGQVEVSATVTNESEAASCFEVTAATSDERIKATPDLALVCLEPNASSPLRIVLEAQGDVGAGRYFAVVSLTDGTVVIEEQLDVAVEAEQGEIVPVAAE